MPLPGNQRQRRTRQRHRLLAEALERRILFSFGVTTGTTPTGQSTYVIDNGGDLKFAIIKGGSLTSTIHMGDLSSVQYKNKEMLATYAQTSRYSHYEQGLGSITNITTTVDNANGWILITCNDSAEASGAVIQYYAIRQNDNNIYMASLPIDVTNGPGEGRFIAYLSRTVFSAPEAPSDNNGNTGSIEGSDVFGHADGTTTSKFFNMGRRMIENTVHGLTGNATGTAAGAWMFMGNREHSAGGPFFKDIDFQASANTVEIYNCIFTGHTQTEAYRQGLHTYAFTFTDGSVPATPDYQWMEALNLQGWIAAAQRGTLTGNVSGIPAGRENTVALSNSAAQYWATPDTAGHYTIAGIQPGNYTETLYLDELAVGTRTITITAGQTTSADIVNSFYTPPAASTVFRIGTWDGTPLGFLNADKIEIMHPSDIRMAAWASTPNFVVGTNTDSQWPMIQFMGVNNSQRITFNLSAAQVQNLTLRIGVTLGFEGGRNKVTVNSGQSYAWTSTNPTASSDLNSRGITRGTWRGNNQLYTFSIPSSALRAGTNTIDLPVISGSYAAGQTWLSPNVVYDAIDLVYTSTASPPAISSVTLSPLNSTVTAGSTKPFAAVAKDALGNALAVNLNWSGTLGAVNPAGLFSAPYTPGSGSITAIATITRTAGYSVTSSSTSTIGNNVSSSGSTTITVVNATIAGRSLFYGGSIYDGASHAAAIATDKSALLPGQSAAFANYSSYSRGINGIMLDVVRPGGTLAAGDFIFRVGNDNNPANWAAAPAPTTITNRTLSGTTSRIELAWPDNAIKGQWLQVTVKGGAGNTSGLAADDVFYFGSAPGEIGDDPAAARVNAMDQLTIRYGAGTPSGITATRDVNRDGIIDNNDEQVARANATYFLNELHLITVPISGGAAPFVAQAIPPLLSFNPSLAQPAAAVVFPATTPAITAASTTMTTTQDPSPQPLARPRKFSTFKNILIKIRRPR